MRFYFASIKSDKGFSLVETLLAVAIGAFLLTTAYFIFNTVLREVYKVEQNIGRMGTKVELQRLLENSCVQINSLTHSQNNLPCLLAGTCTSGLQGPLKIFDETATLFNDPGVTTYDSALKKCLSTQTSCTTTLTSSYRVVCSSGNCKTPDIVVQLKYTKPTAPGVPDTTVEAFDIAFTFPQVYKNCQDAFADGKTASDVYLVDPDGNGGLCPFKIYCEMSAASGQAKALIANAPAFSYAEIPRLFPPLDMQSHGVLQQEYILALFNSTGSAKKITVNIEASAKGNLTVPLQLSDFAQNQLTANVSYCEYGNRNFIAAPSAVLGYLKIGSQSGAGFVGFSTQVVSGNVVGFSCSNCTSDYACNLGGSSCCQQQLKGSLWLE